MSPRQILIGEHTEQMCDLSFWYMVVPRQYRPSSSYLQGVNGRCTMALEPNWTRYLPIFGHVGLIKSTTLDTCQRRSMVRS